tara:strand:+ start:46 stop:303 length:258 start_codon:yes stop_codon:yes gene_type:complete
MPSGPGTYGSKRGRPAKKKMAKKTAKKKVMVKGADLSSLTARQQDTMKKHSVHHTGKHMKMMANMMKRGKTFTQAHKAAQKKVGR